MRARHGRLNVTVIDVAVTCVTAGANRFAVDAACGATLAPELCAIPAV
jgi:hypothetical protein